MKTFSPQNLQAQTFLEMKKNEIACPLLSRHPGEQPFASINFEAHVLQSNSTAGYESESGFI